MSGIADDEQFDAEAHAAEAVGSRQGSPAPAAGFDADSDAPAAADGFDADEEPAGDANDDEQEADEVPAAAGGERVDPAAFDNDADDDEDAAPAAAVAAGADDGFDADDGDDEEGGHDEPAPAVVGSRPQSGSRPQTGGSAAAPHAFAPRGSQADGSPAGSRGDSRPGTSGSAVRPGTSGSAARPGTSGSVARPETRGASRAGSRADGGSRAGSRPDGGDDDEEDGFDKEDGDADDDASAAGASTSAAAPEAGAADADDDDDGFDPAASRSIQDPNYVPVAFNDEEDDLMLFEIPDLPEEKLDELDHMRREVEAAELPDRLAQLRKELEDQTIMVGTVSLDDVKLEEASLEQDRIASVQADLARHQKREQDLLARELEARKRLNAERKTSVLEDREEALAVIARSMISTREQQTAFRKTEERLKAILRDEEATVRVEFGDLVEDESGVKGRRYAVDWDNAPRLVCIKNMVLRAVKNKLLPGRYVMLVTIFDRLGGVPLKWSKLKDFNYFHRTRNPVRHNGRFHDVEISFKQRINKVFLACPSKNDVAPSMCFVFELFQIRNSGLSKTDKVVAWGAFPLADPTFDVIKGYFKVPLLRGEMDPTIDRYEELERRVATNVDNWLCNLYFTIEHWPRYMNGRREYDVELKFTQNLLQLPEWDQGTAKLGVHAEDEEELLDDQEADGGWRGLWNNTQAGAAANAASGAGGAGNRKNSMGDTGMDSIIRGLGGNAATGPSSGTESVRSDASGSVSGGASGGGGVNGFGGVGANDPGKNRAYDVMMSLDKLRNPDEAATAAAAKSDARLAKDNILGDDGLVKHKSTEDFLAKVAASVKPAKHSVKTRHRAAPMDIFKDLDAEEEAEAELMKKKRDDERLAETRRQTRLLQKYRYSIADPHADVQTDPLREKLRYLRSELRADLGLHRIATFEFWSFILIFFLMLWLRVYTHYLAQYLFVEGNGVVVTDFVIRAYICFTEYNATTADLAVEIGASIIGTAANAAIFLVLMAFAWMVQAGTRVFPDTFSRILLSWGVVTTLDPLLILLVDLCDQNWTYGDAFKLYNYYKRHEGNGVPGILLTIAIFLFAMVVCLFLLYQYLLFLHANGRILDIHNRIHGDDGNFFIPQDFELSLRTLRWILTKERRSGTGALRVKSKISVTSYTVRDHLDPNFRATTMHLAIFKQPLNGEEQLFRHFVRQPDGAILEIFDSVEAVGMDEYKKLEERFSKDNDAGANQNKASELVRRGQNANSSGGGTPIASSNPFGEANKKFGSANSTMKNNATQLGNELNTPTSFSQRGGSRLQPLSEQGY